MKNSLKIACSAMALALVLSGTAEARDGFYLAGRGGMTWNNLNGKEDSIAADKVSKLDHVGVYSGAIGYKYKYIRGELEYVWRDDAEEAIVTEGRHTADMTVSSESYMFNMYLDFMPNYWISPYLSAGIGMTKLEMVNKNTGVFGSDEKWEEDKFSWQIGAGLTLRINRCLNLDAGYRYYTLGKIEGAEVNTHEWYGGIRFTF